MTPCCEVCRYYEQGYCYRYPPQLYTYPSEYEGVEQASAWPETSPNDWCGEYLERQVYVTTEQVAADQPAVVQP